MSVVGNIVTHPANAGGTVYALLRAPNWQVQIRAGKAYLDIDYHGLTLRCYAHEHSSSRALYFAGLPDYWEMRFMQDYLKPGDTFLDVGANVGVYTLLARSLVGPDGHVFAFEPNPNSAARLSENLAINKLNNVQLVRAAASDVATQTRLDPTGDSCTSRIALTTETQAEINGQEIESVRLDDYFSNQTIALAKFDIEGYEPFALRGAQRLLAQGNPAVMQIELAGYSERYGVTTDQCINELHDLDYRLMMYLPEKRALVAVQKHWEIPIDNVLAVSNKHFQDVSARLAS